MNIVRLALKQLRREWRGGELAILLASLIIAAAAVSTVGFLSSRVSQVMRVAANAAIAGDLDIRGPTPLPDAYARLAHEHHLQTTTTTGFPSVVLNGERSQLAEIHAIEKGYPLRGQVKLAAVPFGPTHGAHGIPARGTVWAAPRLLTSLGAQVGDTLQLGATHVKVAAVLAFAPGEGIDFVQFAPDLYMNDADLGAAQLVRPGSRIGYHLLVAGAPADVKDYRSALQGRLRKTDRITDIQDTRPEIHGPLRQGTDFLHLAALISVLVAAVALAMAARQYAMRRTEPVAILLSLGMTRNRLLAMLLVQLFVLGLIGALIGAAIGYGAQAGLIALLGQSLPTQLPPPSGTPALTAFGTILILLAGFALAPVLRLRNTPPARILRRDLAPRPVKAFGLWAAALGALIGLLAWQSHDLRLTLYVFAGLGGTAVVLALGAGLALLLLRPLRVHVGTAWRFGLGNLWRRGGQSILQITAFGLGLTVLLWLTLVRVDIFREWHATLPPHIPNQFIFNIQPNQRAPLQGFFRDRDLPVPTLYPMVRGRLVAIDGRHVTPADFHNERARHLLNREANLSVARFRRQENVLTAGEWWTRADYGKHLVSVDEEVAHAFGIGPGDRLTFAIAGDEITLKITSLRKIHWQSFNPNFFFVTPPGVLSGYPTAYITSLHLSPQQGPVMVDLVRKLPGITVIDVGSIIATVRQIIAEASLAVGYVFGFTIAAGILVLLAAVQATRDERRYESALLRTLGAGRATVFQGIVAEFALLGALAGGLGGAAALGVGYLLMAEIFKLPYHPDPWVVPAGLVGGTIVVVSTGLLATRRAVNRPPVETLVRS